MIEVLKSLPADWVRLLHYFVGISLPPPGQESRYILMWLVVFALVVVEMATIGYFVLR